MKNTFLSQMRPLLLPKGLKPPHSLTFKPGTLTGLLRTALADLTIAALADWAIGVS